jgi:O-antigen/teichoic acid export membrane protein
MTTQESQDVVAPESRSGMSGLFGRGLLYVVVWSLQIVSGSLISPVLAHLLGPADFGELASAIALHQVLIILAVLGIDQALILQKAEVRQDGQDRSARVLIAFGIAVATVVTVATGLTGPWWSELLGFSGFSSLLVATVLWTAPGAAVQLMMALLLSQDRFTRFAVLSGLSAIGGQVFGIGLLLLYGRSSGVYAWGGVISQFAAMAIGLAFTRPVLTGMLDRQLVGRAIRLGAPLALSTLLLFVLNAGDRLIIQRMLGPAEVGRYQVAYVVGYVVVLLVVFVGQAWTPQLAEVADRQQRTQLIGRSRDELYGLLIPVVLGLTAAAPIVMRVVAPPSFRPESLDVVVFLVAVSAFAVVASNASEKVLLIGRRPRPLVLAVGCAAALNVALNLALVPVFGIAAAAAATTVAFALRALVQRRAAARQDALPGTPAGLLAGIVAAGAASAAFTQLPQTPAWGVARVAVTALCVAWFLVRLRAARRAEPARPA